jgi:hypothetical protein
MNNTRPEPSGNPDEALPCPVAPEAALASTPVAKPYSAYGKHFPRSPDVHELMADALEAGGF